MFGVFAKRSAFGILANNSRVLRTKAISNDLASKMAKAEREKRRFGEPFVRERLREEFDQDAGRVRNIDVSKSTLRTSSNAADNVSRRSSAYTTTMPKILETDSPSTTTTTSMTNNSNNDVSSSIFSDPSNYHHGNSSGGKEESTTTKDIPPTNEDTWRRRMFWISLAALVWLYGRYRRDVQKKATDGSGGGAQQKESIPVDVRFVFNNLMSREHEEDVLAEFYHSNSNSLFFSFSRRSSLKKTKLPLFFKLFIHI